MTLIEDPTSKVLLPVTQSDRNGSLESFFRPMRTIAGQRGIEDDSNQRFYIQSAVIKQSASKVQLLVTHGDRNGSLESSLRPMRTTVIQKEREDDSN
jgi:hypothetical protein